MGEEHTDLGTPVFFKTWRGLFWKLKDQNMRMGPFKTRSDAEDHFLKFARSNVTGDEAQDFDRVFAEGRPGVFQYIRRAFDGEHLTEENGTLVVQVVKGVRTRVPVSLSLDDFRRLEMPEAIEEAYRRSWNLLAWCQILEKAPAHLLAAMVSEDGFDHAAYADLEGRGVLGWGEGEWRAFVQEPRIPFSYLDILCE